MFKRLATERNRENIIMNEQTNNRANGRLTSFQQRHACVTGKHAINIWCRESPKYSSSQTSRICIIQQHKTLTIHVCTLKERAEVQELEGFVFLHTQRGRIFQRRNGDAGIYRVFLNATACSWRWWHSTKSTWPEKRHSNTHKHVQPTPGLKNRRGMEGKDRERESDGRWDATGVFQHGLVTERLCVCV